MRSLIRFLLWGVIFVAGILAVARFTAFRWLRLPIDDPVLAASVRPTLWEGDLILTARFMKPHFGDLVLCPEPDYPSRYVIGRVLGEGGDHVEFHDGVPTTNGKAATSERRCDPAVFTFPHPDNEAEEVSQDCSWLELAHHLHKSGTIGAHTFRPKDTAVDVPDGKLYLVSDNRLFPYDSRDFGFVDVETCKETIVARIMSKEGWMDSKNRLNYIQ